MQSSLSCIQGVQDHSDNAFGNLFFFPNINKICTKTFSEISFDVGPNLVKPLFGQTIESWERTSLYNGSDVHLPNPCQTESPQ